MDEQQYRADQQARAELTEQTLKVTSQSQPTPTQEENDLLKLGLMHVDEKANPDNPEMPSVAVQQAMLARAQPAVSNRPPGPLAGATPPAAGAPVNRDVPALMGVGVVGGSLNCTMGNWEGEPTSYAYAWKSDAADVGGGGDSYTIAESDSGHSITCVVTATNAAGSTAAPPSNAVVVNGATRGARR